MGSPAPSAAFVGQPDVTSDGDMADVAVMPEITPMQDITTTPESAPTSDIVSVTPKVPTLPSLDNASLDATEDVGNDPAAIQPIATAVEPVIPTAASVVPTAEAMTPTADLNADGLPDLPDDLKPGSMAPVPELMSVDLNEFSPGELNSLSIDPIDPQTDQASSVSPTDKNKVGLEIDENGVKTITGPKLTPAGLPTIGTTDSVATTTEANNVSVPKAETPKTETPKVAVNSGEQLQASASIEEIMALAEQRKASDIHFAANYPIMLRVDGRLAPFSPKLSGEQTAQLAKQLLNEQRQQKFAESKELDFSFTNANQTRFRVNLFTERDNVAGAMRLIEKNIRTMKELDLPDVLFEIVDEPHGLVLVVGPTGSGKSTTLAAMLNHINMNRADHILTIEDPIEYVYPQEMSIVNQREVGADTHAWQAALKSALREDPDVVLVGEMRDLDTIESTITIAETGHLTFATLHTNSAAQAIDRIIDVFPEGSKEQIRAQLANVITAVVSQRLIPVQTGGRRAALEVMLGTVAVRNAIREGKTYQIDNIIQTSGDLGMITLEKSLVNLVKKGYISKDVAKAHSAKPDEIDSLLNNLRI
jgi:twitching motility protein PilT